jgi:Spore coat protein Z.
MNNNSCCIGNILEAINCLQNKAEVIDDIPNTCNRPFLGFPNSNTFVYNTRPVTIYNSSNILFTFPYTITTGGQTTTGESSILRIENVDGNSLTFRILAPNTDETTSSDIPYISTNNFVEVNCNCVCALRCLSDTFVDSI